MQKVQDKYSPILLVGAGWLGEPLAQRLQAQGHKVVVTARRQERILALQSAGLSAWRLDLEDAGETMGLSPRLKSFRTIIWAVPPGKDSHTPYGAQLNRLLVHWPAETGRKLIFYSSTGVYPENAGIWNEKSPIQPDHRVAAAEKEALAWGEQALLLRCGGLCDERRVIGRYFAGKTLSNANQPVNYIHLEDVLSATLHLSNLDATGIYNLVAPMHPERSMVFEAQARRYNFASPSNLESGGVERLISADKLLANGYVFSHPDPQLF